jgi:hypothetical protein
MVERLGSSFHLHKVLGVIPNHLGGNFNGVNPAGNGSTFPQFVNPPVEGINQWVARRFDQHPHYRL